MKRKIKQDFSIKELAGREVKIDEEATAVLAEGMYPARGLFGKWALEEFLKRRPDIKLWPKPSIKLYFVVIDELDIKQAPFVIIAEDEMEEKS